MIDVSTNEPIYVSTESSTGPYIMVPVQQIKDVSTLLDTNEIPYWVDESAISLDGKPEVTVVNIGQTVDAATVQKILDDAS